MSSLALGVGANTVLFRLIAGNLARELPRENRGRSVRVVPIREARLPSWLESDATAGTALLLATAGLIETIGIGDQSRTEGDDVGSEAELHVLRARLDGGIRNKAARGELRRDLPVAALLQGLARCGHCGRRLRVYSGIGYVDEITQTGRGSSDTAGKKVVIGSRDNPIPSDISAANTTFQSAISGTVWENYQLIGVQAYPTDYTNLGTSVADLSTYYLANLVIESNEELQNFRGKKPATTADLDNMYSQGKTLNMGGCMGCHGVGQLNGGDFNFLIVNSPFGAPEVVGASGTISFRQITSST